MCDLQGFSERRWVPVKITSQKSPLDVTLEVKEAPAKGMGTRNRPQSVLTTASSLAHSPAPLHRALVASWMETVGGRCSGSPFLAHRGCFHLLVSTKASDEWDRAVLAVPSLPRSKMPGPHDPHPHLHRW